MTQSRPSVGVVMTAASAASSISNALESIETQDYAGPIDVVVATADPETEQAASRPGIRVIDNPNGRTPTGLNRAIGVVDGDVIVRVDAQSRLPNDYITRTVDLLDETGADVVGGMQEPIGRSFWERSIAAAMASRLGSGDSVHRVGGSPGPTDTVYLGVFKREAVDRVGGYDESFFRNQDYELNYRIRESGGVVWFDPRIRVAYRPRPGLPSLARQYFQYGTWKRHFMRKHPGGLRPRQLAPPLLIATLTAALLGSLVWSALLAIPAVYVLLLLIVGVSKLSTAGVSALGAPVALAVMHLSWGLGFLFGQTSDR